MRQLPTKTYPDKQGVTLKCTRVQEAVSLKNLTRRCSLTGLGLLQRWDRALAVVQDVAGVRKGDEDSLDLWGY